jgi:hypothetical protein
VTFDGIKALTDRQVLGALYIEARKTDKELRSRTAGERQPSGDLALVLEERLRGRFERVKIVYEHARPTTIALDAFILSWPATTDPRRVRVDAYLWACQEGR